MDSFSCINMKIIHIIRIITIAVLLTPHLYNSFIELQYQLFGIVLR
jgi:hypothetical protein